MLTKTHVVFFGLASKKQAIASSAAVASMSYNPLELCAHGMASLWQVGGRQGRGEWSGLVVCACSLPALDRQ